MYALICKGNGKYYSSPVYGYYRNVTASDEYQRYLKQIHAPYYVVWNEEKTKLIKWLTMVPNTEYIIPQIIIVDSDQSDWNLNKHGEGCVTYLSRELIEEITDKDNQPAEILEICRKSFEGYVLEEYPEIKNEKDIEDLMWASGGFHDACIENKTLLDDGTLYLLFDGVWGCKIEVWFWGELEYDTSSRASERCDPCWFGSTIILEDGFVYFVDADDMTVEKITDIYCRFKARHMKYHIIPD